MQLSFADKYAAQGLNVVALDPDTDDIGLFAELQDYVAYLGPTYPVGIETSLNYSPISSIYSGANPFPVDIIVGKDGTIRYIAREYDPVTMDTIIQEALAEP